MPELPDITVYIEALEKRIVGQRAERVRIVSPFLLRTVEPAVASVEGKKVVELRRLGKRICIGVDGGIWLVLHLMITGRLHWFDKIGKAVKLGGRQNLAAFEFSSGTLVWTEAGSQKRASLHLARGEEGLRELDPGGAEVLECSLAEFAEVLRSENHTLKRALTDPRWFSGSTERSRRGKAGRIWCHERTAREHAQDSRSGIDRPIIRSWLSLRYPSCARSK